jgi:hypothetical protein
MSIVRKRASPLDVLLCVVLALTAVFSVTQVAARSRGCCGTADCAILGSDPYVSCSNPDGQLSVDCEPAGPDYHYCCETGGWCGKR